MPWDSCLEEGVATLLCIPIAAKNVIQWALIFAAIVAVIIIIYSGFKFVTSKGDPQEVDNAKKTMTYAIIGLILVFLSFFIVNLIGTLTGVDQITSPTL